MAKLYVFGIGGTGSRVLNSLTLLLASGIEVEADEIIPMIIDTDMDNGNLEDCRDTIRQYNQIHQTLYGDVASHESFQGDFFRTKIHPPKELNISGRDYGTLAAMIAYENMVPQGMGASKKLTDLLFTEHHLKEMNLEKGFLGHPNVGSIVLKNVVKSSEFKEFTQSFKPGDRIFIISSIFGGTGAAGFPLLLKLFRSINSGLQNDKYIADAIIGATTVLPYFEVDVEKFQSGESAINSNTFISKTKAALTYYDKSISDLVNALYYIGDTKWSNYENIDGGRKQKNLPNFIELAAALSMIDFMNFEPGKTDHRQLERKNQYFQFGIGQDISPLILNHLNDPDSKIDQHLIKFMYFQVYLTNYLETALKNKNLAWRQKLALSDNYANSEFIKRLRTFAEKIYYYWLIGMDASQHGRRFSPFRLPIANLGELTPEAECAARKPVQLNPNNDNLFELVNGISPKRKKGFLTKDKIKFDDIFTNHVEMVKGANHALEHLRFMRLMNVGMSALYAERFQN